MIGQPLGTVVIGGSQVALAVGAVPTRTDAAWLLPLPVLVREIRLLMTYLRDRLTGA